MRIRSTLAVGALAAATLILPAAGPPNGDRISSEADWVTHIDVAAVVNSRLGKHLLDNPEDFDIDLDELNEIEEMLGIELLEEVLEVTVYGDDEDHMVALVRTTDAIDDALEELEAHEESPLTRHRQGDAEIYSVEDGDVLFHVMELRRGGRMLVMSDNADVLAIGIAAAYGRGETLGDRLKVRPIDGGLVYFAATSIPIEHDGDDPASIVLQNATAVSGRIAEQGDDIVVDAQVATGNTEDARNIADILQGLIALGRVALAGADDEGTQDLVAFLDGIRISASDTDIRLEIRQPVEMMLKAMSAASEER